MELYFKPCGTGYAGSESIIMVYTDNGKLRVVYGDCIARWLHGKGFDYTFSYALRAVWVYCKNGYEWLYVARSRPSRRACLTDNDRGNKIPY